MSKATKKPPKSVELIREYDDAGYWVRLQRSFAVSSDTAQTASKTATARYERAARKLFKALAGRYPTADELDDLLY